MRADHGDISLDGTFKNVVLTINVTYLFAFGKLCPDGRTRKKTANAGTACANALGECALGDQL